MICYFFTYKDGTKTGNMDSTGQVNCKFDSTTPVYTQKIQGNIIGLTCNFHLSASPFNVDRLGGCQALEDDYVTAPYYEFLSKPTSYTYMLG
jgi:hypothetical protein